MTVEKINSNVECSPYNTKKKLLGSDLSDQTLMTNMANVSTKTLEGKFQTTE